MDIEDTLNQYDIPYYTGGYKQCREGWVNLRCPFCNGFPHLGIFLETGAVNCYQCGTHSLTSVMSRLLNRPWKQHEIIKSKTKITPNRKINHKIKLPYGCNELNGKHLKYLKNRGLPQEVAKIWKLRGTSHLGEYRGRIIAPIFYNGVMVSFQARDITGNQTPKYKACPKHNEIIHHKDILYGIDKVKGSVVIVVEGIVDVWKLGVGTVATFGIEWKNKQALLLSERFDDICIWFDPDPQAQKQAKRLGMLLTVLGKNVILVNYEQSDPGDMNFTEARATKNQLMDWLLQPDSRKIKISPAPPKSISRH